MHLFVFCFLLFYERREEVESFHHQKYFLYPCRMRLMNEEVQ